MQTLASLNFVELAALNKGFIIELPYKTPHNFVHKPVYDDNAKAYLRTKVAHALCAAQQVFQQQQLTLKIWDAYRPFHIQEVLWDYCADERYVAKPVRDNDQMVAGSMHNRGAAVDVTLVDIKTGEELVMPTLFDDFSSAAHRNNQDCSTIAKQNRQLLQDVMHANGFVGLPTEWWHFSWHAEDEFALCDLPMD